MRHFGHFAHTCISLANCNYFKCRQTYNKISSRVVSKTTLGRLLGLVLIVSGRGEELETKAEILHILFPVILWY